MCFNIPPIEIAKYAVFNLNVPPFPGQELNFNRIAIVLSGTGLIAAIFFVSIAYGFILLAVGFVLLWLYILYIEYHRTVKTDVLTTSVKVRCHFKFQLNFN